MQKGTWASNLQAQKATKKENRKKALKTHWKENRRNNGKEDREI